MSGWFAIKHGIRKHPIFKGRPERLGAWVAMLDEAAFADTRQDVNGEIIEIKRGELCASQAMLQSMTGLTRKQLRTFLDILEREGAIRTRPATKRAKSRAIVTFCNYGKYQTPGPSEGQTGAKQGPIKEQDNNIPVGEPPSAASNVVNFSSPRDAVWKIGKAYLADHGINEKQAGAQIGRWLKDAKPSELLDAIDAARRAETQDPIPYITAIVTKRKRNPEPGDTRVTPDGRHQVYVNHYDGWMVENA